jgi:hypothetical protein
MARDRDRDRDRVAWQLSLFSRVAWMVAVVQVEPFALPRLSWWCMASICELGWLLRSKLRGVTGRWIFSSDARWCPETFRYDPLLSRAEIRLGEAL